MPPRVRRAFLAALVTVGVLGADEAKPKEPEKPATTFVEAFQKGPVLMTAKVVRRANGAETTSPLFRMPVLQFQDQLELAFAGEAFDPRVTGADWTVIVVFLPRTVAPTDRGVVDFRLKKKDGRMVVPPIPVPYDSIPMIFLLPDRGGRKKVLADLGAHLGEFRTLCAKIQALSEERAAADKFLADLDAIDKNLSAVAYDNAVQNFLHAYGSTVSADAQAFLSTRTGNLEKFQFLTQEFRKTNVLVPDAASGGAAATAQVQVSAGGGRAASAYVSIFFDLAMIIHNLWPGHQFQYLPALARNFTGFDAELYYSDWIRTTGDQRGALMCCPGKWSDQAAPGFSFELGKGESLLRKEALLQVQPRSKDSLPFSLYGHDWKLLLAGPGAEALAPIPLSPSPGKQAFVAVPGAALEPLRKRGAVKVQARIVGRWGLTSVSTDPVDLPVGCDPAWTPSPAEAKSFEQGGACAFLLPGAWAGAVDKAQFRFQAGPVLPGELLDKEGGARQVTFKPKPGQAGPGFLELFLPGADAPALSRPLDLRQPPPELLAVEARPGEVEVRVRGRHLGDLQALELGTRAFLPAAVEADQAVFRAQDGKPLEGVPGKPLQAIMVLKDGRREAPALPVALGAPRPRLGEVRLDPVHGKAALLSLAASVPVAPSAAPSQLHVMAGKGYRFPPERTFRVAFRNADDPGEVRQVPGAKVQVVGNNTKATLLFNPADVLGGRGSGRLELQVQDDRAGASDWVPLPALFVDLPLLAGFRAGPGGLLVTGPSLDPIDEVAAAAAGPWQKLRVALEDGQEVARVPQPGPEGQYWLRLVGWPDLVLTVRAPEARPGQ